MRIVDQPATAAANDTAPLLESTARLRLYVARLTPNSVRAEHNLSVVLARLTEDFASPVLETIDVFAQPRRAFTDGVVVTPTLIGVNASQRFVLMGDLADQAQLEQLLRGLLATS